MSQFFLVCGPKPGLEGLTGLRFVDLAGASWLVERAAFAVLSAAERAQCWFVVDEQECSDGLFTDAQRALHDDADFKTTRVCKLFERILPTAEKIVLWYSDEWDDLPIVTDGPEFLRQLEQALRTDRAECWLMFRGRSAQN